MLKTIIVAILKRFANLGKLSFDKRPNLTMRLFIFINSGMHVFFIPTLGRICSAPSKQSAKGKFRTHEVVELSRGDVIKYLLTGDKFKKMLIDNIGKVRIEHREGYGEDTMKITFSRSGTRIKLNTTLVPKETVSKLLELIKHQDVTQTMRSPYVGISSLLKPTYTVKLYSATKKVHIGNYNATSNIITSLIPT